MGTPEDDQEMENLEESHDEDSEQEDQPEATTEEPKEGSLSQAQVSDIQQKLLTKVLPILESHLFESDKRTARGFVAQSYA